MEKKTEEIEVDGHKVTAGYGADPSVFADALQSQLDHHPDKPYVEMFMMLSREMAEIIITMLTTKTVH